MIAFENIKDSERCAQNDLVSISKIHFLLLWYHLGSSMLKYIVRI